MQSWYWRELVPKMQLEVLQNISSLRKGPLHPLKFLNKRVHPEQLVEPHLLKSHFREYQHEVLSLKSLTHQPQNCIAVGVYHKYKLWRRSPSANAEKSLKITPPYTISCLFAEKLLQLSQFLEGSDICHAERQCSKTISVCNRVKHSVLFHISKVSCWQLHTSTGNTNERLLRNSQLHALYFPQHTAPSWKPLS